ncbi:MAG TPA: SRPBCC family protein [Sporichthyaceae bacterium]|nr:SRPBCC family protein [Sporichthyaceae bacterium]
MATVRHHIRIDAPADKVWGVIRDAGSVADWFGPLSSSETTATGRVVTLGDGTVIDEDILTSDDALRRFQYTIKSGLPVEHHIGTFDVLEDGAGSLVVYAADVRPDELAPTFDAVMGQGIQDLKAFCEK